MKCLTLLGTLLLGGLLPTFAMPAPAQKSPTAKGTPSQVTPVGTPPTKVAPIPMREPVAFTVTSPAAGFVLPEIVLNYNPETKTGYDWEIFKPLTLYGEYSVRARPVFQAVRYLREAVQRMTGKELPIVSKPDLSRGLVLTTIDIAPADIKNDPEVKHALRDTGEDAYNYREAYFVRTEPSRIVIVANTYDGVAHGVTELCESVGYEILAMGTNWIHTPDYKDKPLVLKLSRADRPGFYLRALNPTSGQSYGVGTLFMQKLHHPDDEILDIGYWRWALASRFQGQSMPQFPGHSLQQFHRPLVEKIKETGRTEGFLVTKTNLGLDAARPASTKENAWQLWINTDAAGQPETGKVYMSYGTEWKKLDLAELGVNIDLSVPVVRQIALENMKKSAADFFRQYPDDVFVYGTDPEDGGGYTDLAKLLYDKNWYPDYLKAEGVPFGRPYVLHGFKGLDQPKEIWDPNAPSDTVFGFNNWLLREYDKWIDSLPEAERVTSTGKSKKAQARVSLYSYNYHDVPPNFNLDPRVRAMIASYPKHRGMGKWRNFVTQQDMARAFKIMLPREPSGDYWIISLGMYWDVDTNYIHAGDLPATIHKSLREEYDAGFRALSCEIDFNFGKMGLNYYLYSKFLWNPNLTVADMEGLRDRWLQRAYGSGWREMREYYNFLARDNFKLNAQNGWARAIRLLDAADPKIDSEKEPAAQRRLDDLKQYWYYHYLVESGQAKPPSRAMKEFVWKGQMSYVNAMHVPVRTFFQTYEAKDAAGLEFNTGPAHYTAAETAEWWAKVLDFWKLTPVDAFAEGKLADGTLAKDLDVNDLVMVQEFNAGKIDSGFYYNAGYQKHMTFLNIAKKAGDEIGFKYYWPWTETDGYYRARDVFYGIDRWDAKTKAWSALVDKTMISKRSQTTRLKDGKDYQLVEVRFPAPLPGTYRVDVGTGGNVSQLTSLTFDVQTLTYTGPRGHTYNNMGEGLTQDECYIYIPKGTKSFDIEVWDNYNYKQLTFHTGLPAKGMAVSRNVEIKTRGTHRIALQPGEDGSLVAMRGAGFAMPFLYSVPMLWAKGTPALLVPRAVAKADGLTVAE